MRVFAFLGSLASAGLLLFPAIPYPVAWVAVRLLLGFCFCGIYIVGESWLNNTTTNETRGRALSLYMIAQMVGIVAAQAIFAAGDADDYLLFVVVSVLVSLAFTPMLLSATPMPPFERASPMSLRRLFEISPLGFVGVLLLGAVFSAVFGMVGVYGAQAGLGTGQIALFVTVIYVGGLVIQYPAGWLSDRMDRRQLVLIGGVVGVLAGLLGWTGFGGFAGSLVAAFLIGGTANPLYSILVAYTNDVLAPEDMASASARLLFVNGVGAIGGPLVTGWLMGVVGPGGFFAFLTVLMLAIAGYAAWRMTRRASVVMGAQASHTMLSPMAMTSLTMSNVVEGWEEEAAEVEPVR